jgi:hypothetical protein
MAKQFIYRVELRTGRTAIVSPYDSSDLRWQAKYPGTFSTNNNPLLDLLPGIAQTQDSNPNMWRYATKGTAEDIYGFPGRGGVLPTRMPPPNPRTHPPLLLKSGPQLFLPENLFLNFRWNDDGHSNGHLFMW